MVYNIENEKWEMCQRDNIRTNDQKTAESYQWVFKTIRKFHTRRCASAGL